MTSVKAPPSHGAQQLWSGGNQGIAGIPPQQAKAGLSGGPGIAKIAKNERLHSIKRMQPLFISRFVVLEPALSVRIQSCFNESASCRRAVCSSVFMERNYYIMDFTGFKVNEVVVGRIIGAALKHTKG